jgi:hypothetical protein
MFFFMALPSGSLARSAGTACFNFKAKDTRSALGALRVTILTSAVSPDF